jgi:O-antigen ligase
MNPTVNTDAVAQYTFLRQLLFFLTALLVVGVTFSIAVSSIAMGTAIILWWFFLIITKGKVFTRTPLDYFFLFYAIAELLATIFSVDPASSVVNMKRLFLISIVYLVMISIDDEKKIKSMLVYLLGIGALLSVLEIFSLESVGGHFVRVALFQYFLTEGGIKMFLLLLALPLIIHKGTPRGWRFFAAVCSVPLFIGLVLTQTRSSWLGFITGVVAIGMMKSKKIILALVILIIVFLLFAPADFRSRAASIFDPTMTSNLTRIHMITTGWRMFLDRPLTGFGDIDLRKYYVTYIEPLDEAEGGHLHNNIMMLLVTLGIVGFVATMAMFVKILLVEFKAMRALSQSWLHGSITLGCFAAYLSFHVNGLFEWNFGDHEIAVLLWFTVGMAIVSQRLSLQLSEKPS